MYWRLGESMTACIASGQVVVLDVARDRYFALPPSANDAFASWLTQPDTGAPPATCRRILAEMMALDQNELDGLRPVPCRVAMPDTLDAAPLPAPVMSSRNLVGVGRAVVSAWRDVRTKPLALVLGRRLAPGRDEQAAAADGSVPTRLAEFRAVRPLIPVPRVCLHDCLALIDWLGPASVPVQLVFGVTAFPFAAHSWVQAGGRVVDDHPESASRFQPILHFA